MWLLEHAGLLNLIVSAVVCIAGLVILRFFRPKVFDDYPYTRFAFEFWLFQWGASMLIFAVLQRTVALSWVLALVDLQSVFALGFFFVFARGNQFQLRPIILDLIFIYMLLLVWNLAFVVAADASGTADLWRPIWISFSAVLSVVALGLLAIVFVSRYGWAALPFVVVAALYILVQRPIYEATFIIRRPEPVWVVALAFLKLLFGSLFYTMFFLSAKNYNPLQLDVWRLHSPLSRGQKLLVSSLVLVGGVLIHVISVLIAHKIERLFHL